MNTSALLSLATMVSIATGGVGADVSQNAGAAVQAGPATVNVDENTSAGVTIQIGNGSSSSSSAGGAESSAASSSEASSAASSTTSQSASAGSGGVLHRATVLRRLGGGTMHRVFQRIRTALYRVCRTRTDTTQQTKCIQGVNAWLGVSAEAAGSVNIH